MTYDHRGSMKPAALALALLLAAAAAAAPSGGPPIRGIVVSCPTWGPIWGSPAMAESLGEIRELGARWAAIHPYAWVGTDGSVRFRPAAQLGFLDRAVELAAAAGVELFWKPHLGYWGSFAWRGDIQFGDDEAAWRRFFDGYRAFIVDQARFAESAGVPLFAVGVEVERTTHREAEWRRILDEVRTVYGGRVVYAANWDTLDRVPFWDAVDLIGVHGYFPLADGDDPDLETIRRGWDAPLAHLAALSRAHDKPVLFAEIGYNRSTEAAREPWAHEIRDSPAARALRSRLIRAAVERLEAEPFVAGMFWWKWIPGDTRGDPDFSMKNPEARETLARSWGAAGERRDAATAR